MGKKVALITGITGQDGSYLAEYLLEKGYEVHGMKRRTSAINTARLDALIEKGEPIYLHYGDLSDHGSIFRILQRTRPTEIYNLGAQSHVAVSFEIPLHTADVNALGTLRVLEAVRQLGMEREIRFYQASSSEMYGEVQETPQSEKTPFYPRSPYACAKLFAYWTVVNYREAYDIYACNGILFNHESPRRGETFVTRKISRAFARIALGLQRNLVIGNLDAKRDWGHAEDYVKMQWLMLQQKVPQDFVIATGEQASVRDFIVAVAAAMEIELLFQGSGLAEVGIVNRVDGPAKKHVNVGDTVVKVDERYYRPSEVNTLLGTFAKAKELMGWQPKRGWKELASEMAAADLKDISARASKATSSQG